MHLHISELRALMFALDCLSCELWHVWIITTLDWGWGSFPVHAVLWYRMGGLWLTVLSPKWWATFSGRPLDCLLVLVRFSRAHPCYLLWFSAVSSIEFIVLHDSTILRRTIEPTAKRSPFILQFFNLGLHVSDDIVSTREFSLESASISCFNIAFLYCRRKMLFSLLKLLHENPVFFLKTFNVTDHHW